MQEKLPVYLLIDTSGSMKGEPIESAKVGIESLISTLKNDVYMSKTVELALISFDKDVKLIFPLTPISNIVLNRLVTPDAGPTHLGAALVLLNSQLKTDLVKYNKRNINVLEPIIFIMTDGKPSDVLQYDEMCMEFKKKNYGTIIACAAGSKAKVQPLEKLTQSIYQLENLDSCSFINLFSKLTTSINEHSLHKDEKDNSNELISPPKELTINF